MSMEPVEWYWQGKTAVLG